MGQKHPRPLAWWQNLKLFASFHLRIKSLTFYSENKQILIICIKYIICQIWTSLITNYRINLLHTWPFSTHSVFFASKAALSKELHWRLWVIQWKLSVPWCAQKLISRQGPPELEEALLALRVAFWCLDLCTEILCGYRKNVEGSSYSSLNP